MKRNLEKLKRSSTKNKAGRYLEEEEDHSVIEVGESYAYPLLPCKTCTDVMHLSHSALQISTT